jgi:hypothetical protein
MHFFLFEIFFTTKNKQELSSPLLFLFNFLKYKVNLY